MPKNWKNSLKTRLEGIKKLMEAEDEEVGLSDDGTAAIMLLEGIIKDLEEADNV